MGFLSWWSSMSQGNDAADMIIEKGHTVISTESLYSLADRVNARDPDTFVATVIHNLDDHETDEYIKENGTLWQKFRAGVWP
jgi:hypothetical protein